MLKKLIMILAIAISPAAFTYNQLLNDSKPPHKVWGLSVGLGIAGNAVGIKPQAAVGKSVALVMPITASLIPPMTLLKHEIAVLRIHGGLGFKWHIGQYIDWDAWFFEPVLNAGLTQVDTESYVALKPALAFGYSFVWDGGFILSLALTGQYEFLMGEKKSVVKKLQKDFAPHYLLLNQFLGAEMSFGLLF